MNYIFISNVIPQIVMRKFVLKVVIKDNFVISKDNINF